jgi:hypothetical protein
MVNELITFMIGAVVIAAVVAAVVVVVVFSPSNKDNYFK